MSRWLVLTAVLATSLVARAQVPVADPDRSAYLELMNDVYAEARTMDAVTETPAERQIFISALGKTLLDPMAPNPCAEPNRSWTGMWPPKPAQDTVGVLRVAGPRAATDVVTVVPKTGMDSEHALMDPANYVAQRLGEAAAGLLAKGAIVAAVHGGFERSAIEQLGVPETDVIRIPSFYERWGISKFFVLSKDFADGKPRILFVVPPSRQYLLHYATMLSVIHAGSDGVIMDRLDQNAYRQAMHRGAIDVATKLGGRMDYADMGYYGQWEEVLASPQSPWRLVSASSEVGSIMGLGGKALTIAHKLTGQTVRVVLIKSDLAIWGESSAFIAEGLLDLPGVKGLLFMGSAGGISKKAEVYGLSVPRAFATQGGPVVMTNFVQPLSSRGAEIAAVPVTFESTHGNTFSPIEQDRTFLFRMRDTGIDTLDVEQSLVALAVSKHNMNSPHPVLFGAVNLVTDRPARVLDGVAAANDLDKVDFARKGAARLGAVRLALEALSLNEAAVHQPAAAASH